MGSQLLVLLVLCLSNVFLICYGAVEGGMLYAKESETREIKELNGLWNFRADKSDSRDAGFTQKWFMQSLAKVNFIYR